MDKSHLKTARPLAKLREGRTDWYRIQNLAGTGAAEVWIYDEIGYWGVTAQEFVGELNAIKANAIDVHINTPGGDAFDGLAIYQALRNHPARITTYVDALAASAGSFIAMAGDDRVIAPHASLMIHDAFGMCIGNAAEMAKMQDDLARLSDNVAGIYASRAGGDVETWREAMRAETWYSAVEAVAAGLAHRVQEDPKAAEKPDKPAAKNSWDLSIFTFAGRDKAPAPRNSAGPADDAPAPADPPVVDDPTPPVAPALPETPPAPQGAPQTPAAEPVTPTEPKEERVSDDIRSLLGVPDDADDDAIKAAITDLKAKADKPTQPEPTPTPAPQPDGEPAPDRQPEPVGASAALNEMKAEISRLSQEVAASKAEKAAQVKANVFDSAVQAGKIRPADRGSWEARYDKAPEVITDILASIEPGTAVPVRASGVTGDAEPVGVPDALVADIDAIFTVKPKAS